ncbi:DUF3891 family protein [Hymenobacter psychrophilus]|uniref:DUF3891 domain-containing protein n=1 Tax=Hymenobacter psychrophilus TaxID=651662 RepID=A0A1H3HLP8_9BACT|nr:DUF3891 family protein [Hymenobacter psychrophilus]SDY16456.1 Protein of unknown function [Hymenobacter psychrophilus]
MIVNYVPTGWQIIYQQAHALLAAQLLHQWPADLLPPDQWVGLLAAAAQHDDEQPHWSGHYGLTPAGAPANFTMQPFSLEQATGVLRAARFQGRWRSLLTSLHLSTLYEELRGQKKEIDAFLDEQRQNQQTWRRELKIKKAETDRAYALLHWCDRLSLILCRHEIPEMGRALEIYQGPNGQTHAVHRATVEAPLTVSPWPFRDKQFEVSVEATMLGQLQFKNDAELSAALASASVTTLRWLFKNE